MTLNRGDVAIALFPNADGSPPKPRHVVVVQSNAYNAKLNNVLVVAVTTNLTHASDSASFLVDVSTHEGKASGLRRNSVVCCVNIATIKVSLVAKVIGQLSTGMMHQVNGCLKAAFDLP